MSVEVITQSVLRARASVARIRRVTAWNARSGVITRACLSDTENVLMTRALLSARTTVCLVERLIGGTLKCVCWMLDVVYGAILFYVHD